MSLVSDGFSFKPLVGSRLKKDIQDSDLCKRFDYETFQLLTSIRNCRRYSSVPFISGLKQDAQDFTKHLQFYDAPLKRDNVPLLPEKITSTKNTKQVHEGMKRSFSLAAQHEFLFSHRSTLHSAVKPH